MSHTLMSEIYSVLLTYFAKQGCRNDRKGSKPDSHPVPLLGLLSRAKQTKTPRKRTSTAERRLLGVEQTFNVRRCQDRL